MESRKPKIFKKSDLKFIAGFIVVFILTFSVLYLLGLVPTEFLYGNKESFTDNLKLHFLQNIDSKSGVEEMKGEDPVSISIPKIDVNISVSNPNTTTISILDEYLKKGAVRYPGSGLIGKGNMLIFGHSADLYKNVLNPALKAFNGFNGLEVGDTIIVSSASTTYSYKVTNVRLAKADETLVDFSKKENMLTLSTCNTFGAKQDRYIVEATFVGKL